MPGSGGSEGVLGGDVAVSMLVPWLCCSQQPGHCAALPPLNWGISTTHCLPDAARPLPRLGPVSVVELEADKGSQAGSEGFPWRAAWAGAPAEVSAGAGAPSREVASSSPPRKAESRAYESAALGGGVRTQRPHRGS